MSGPPPIDDRTALVTGATSGIGRALAEALAASGLTIAIVARDRVRGDDAVAAIASRTGNERVERYDGDLSSLSSVRRLAEAVVATHPRIDVLVHCAAVYVPRRTVTAEGYETMFATNHLGPFLLTNLLLPSLTSDDGARILILSAPSTVRPDFDDPQGERRFRSLSTFGATKAANLLFVYGLARRLEGRPITVNAVHPGLARTSLMRQAPPPIRWLQSLTGRSPDRVAADIAPLALSADYAGKSGRFYHRGHEIDSAPFTYDVTIQDRLWALSEELTRTTS